MLAAAILLPFANEQTSRILLAVPFGVAWALFGLALLRRREPTRAEGPELHSTSGVGGRSQS